MASVVAAFKDDATEVGDDVMADVDSGNRQTPPMPVEDPTLHLHPTALRLLKGAEQIVIDQGLHKLTLDAVAARAKENRGLIHYHFRTKGTLLTTLVDWTMYRTCLSMTDEFADARPKVRIPAFIEALRGNVESRDLYVLNYELLPYVLRKPDLRARVARVYEWYWRVNLGWLGAENASPNSNEYGLAVIAAALCDGLAVQVALRQPELDLDSVFRTLEMLLKSSGPPQPDGDGL